MRVLSIVLAAAAVLALLLVGTSFQVAATAPSSWPPVPGAMVNWCAFQELGPHGAAVPFNSEVVLFNVPITEALVLTEWFTPSTSNSTTVRIIERVNGTDTVKYVLPTASGVQAFGRDGLGLVFRRGSQVVLKNAEQGGTGDYYITPDVRWIGYLRN